MSAPKKNRTTPPRGPAPKQNTKVAEQRRKALRTHYAARYRSR